MVDVGMGQKNIVDLRLIHGQRAVFKGIDPLLHSIIHQHMLFPDLHIVAAPCHFMVRSNKLQFHTIPPLRLMLPLYVRNLFKKTKNLLILF